MAVRDDIYAHCRKTRKCWNWRRSLTSAGYGNLWTGRKYEYAHRYSWELANGRKLRRNEQVRHSCDNPRCIRPSHLQLGSNYDNMQDKAARGRAAIKLNRRLVRAIRAAHAGGSGYKILAARYGLHHSTVADVVRIRSWRYA